LTEEAQGRKKTCLRTGVGRDPLERTREKKWTVGEKEPKKKKLGIRGAKVEKKVAHSAERLALPLTTRRGK